MIAPHALPHALQSAGMNGWDVLCDDYWRYLLRRGRSLNSIRAYRSGCADFERFMEVRGRHLDTLTAPDIEAWQDSQVGRLALSTRQSYANHVRGPLLWAAQKGKAPRELADVIVVPKVPAGLPRPIPEADVARILRYFARPRPKAPIQWWRNRAMFLYLLSTTARVSEILSLDVADLEVERVIVTQKGGGQKMLYAPPSALRAVADYVRRRRDDHPALFVTHGGAPPIRRISSAGVREVWHDLADLLRIPRFTTHQIRHSGATELLEDGIPVEVVAEHLGHANLATVMNYAKVSERRRMQVIEAMEARLAVRKPEWQPVVIKGGRGRRRELY